MPLKNSAKQLRLPVQIVQEMVRIVQNWLI